VVLSLVFVASAPGRLLAQVPPEFELPDVISPGRRPQRAASSPASVTVLTAADLHRLGVRTVGEAIAFVPEALARAYGGPGSLITPSLRGSTAEQVLVLLDGVPLNSAFAGTVDLSTIPVDDVERIEVLRGPFSAIYGSAALGGVISIVSRRRARLAVSLSGGSFGLTGLAVATGGDARFSLRYEGAVGARPNSDLRSGYLSMRLGGGSPGRTWDLSLMATAASRGAPGPTLFPSLTARQEDARIVASLGLERERGPATDRLRVAVHRDRIAFREPAFAIDERSDGTSWSVGWQRAIRRSPTRVVAVGADARYQTLASTSVGDRWETIGALYVQDDRALGPRTLLSAGARVDLHSAYGAQVNPRLGLVHFMRPDLRLRLAVGRTFRGPTLADLYYPFDGFVVGNPLLRPEHAWSADAGVEFVARSGLVLRASAFWSEVRDLIVYLPDAAFVFSPQNIGAASIRGASLELEGALSAAWQARASATWMAATDGATGLDLPNRPALAGSLGLTRRLSRGGAVTATLVAVGERFANAANTVRLPGYLTVGLIFEAPPMADGVTLRASVQNLFDARYEAVQGYPVPGRTMVVDVVIRR
jgi:outer membrane cobalamin receptor